MTRNKFEKVIIGDWKCIIYYPEEHTTSRGIRYYHIPCEVYDQHTWTWPEKSDVLEGLCPVCKAYIPDKIKMLALLRLGYISTH